MIEGAQGYGAVDYDIFVSKMWVSVSLAEASCTDSPYYVRANRMAYTWQYMYKDDAVH